MSHRLFAGVRALCACAIVSTLAGTAQGAILDWGSGWDNNAGAEWGTGATTGSTTVDGVNIDVSVATFGTATGFNSFLGTTPAASDTYNGDQGPGDPALAIGDSNSFNLGADFENYLKVTITFDQLVDITRFNIGDIDISSGGSWQDVVVVLGSASGSNVAAAYNPEANAFFETRDYNFPGTGESFRGVTGIDPAGNDTDDAQFAVSFAGLVNQIEIFYWNGPDASNSQGRGIYIQDIEFIPSPGAIALAGAGVLVGGIRRRRNR